MRGTCGGTTAVDVEGATGDDAVQVDVEAELLIPRMEDGQKAPLAAQMVARIGAEGEERVGDRLEEDLIQDGIERLARDVEIAARGGQGWRMTPIAPLITSFMREHMPVVQGYSPHTCDTPTPTPSGWCLPSPASAST